MESLRGKGIWKGGQEKEEKVLKWDVNDLELGGWNKNGVCPEFIKYLLIFLCLL